MLRQLLPCEPERVIFYPNTQSFRIVLVGVEPTSAPYKEAALTVELQNSISFFVRRGNRPTENGEG